MYWLLCLIVCCTIAQNRRASSTTVDSGQSGHSLSSEQLKHGDTDESVRQSLRGCFSKLCCDLFIEHNT